MRLRSKIIWKHHGRRRSNWTQKIWYRLRRRGFTGATLCDKPPWKKTTSNLISRSKSCWRRFSLRLGAATSYLSGASIVKWLAQWSKCGWWRSWWTSHRDWRLNQTKCCKKDWMRWEHSTPKHTKKSQYLLGHGRSIGGALGKVFMERRNHTWMGSTFKKFACKLGKNINCWSKWRRSSTFAIQTSRLNNKWLCTSLI